MAPVQWGGATGGVSCYDDVQKNGLRARSTLSEHSRSDLINPVRCRLSQLILMMVEIDCHQRLLRLKCSTSYGQLLPLPVIFCSQRLRCMNTLKQGRR